jgi:hypothetical protein
VKFQFKLPGEADYVAANDEEGETKVGIQGRIMEKLPVESLKSLVNTSSNPAFSIRFPSSSTLTKGITANLTQPAKTAVQPCFAKSKIVHGEIFALPFFHSIDSLIRFFSNSAHLFCRSFLLYFIPTNIQMGQHFQVIH